MSWTPIAERFPTLPLILAGPILRRTEPQAVTVWLALKKSQTVTLRIYYYSQCFGTTAIDAYSVGFST